MTTFLQRTARAAIARGLCVACGLATTACATVGPGVSGLVDVADGRPAIELTYLGAGGWIIEVEDDQVVAGPLFTNPSFLRTGLMAIESDTLEVDRYMADYDVSNTHVILVGHGHYDHAMDVPRVALRHAPAARILANRTTANLYGSWAGVSDRMDVTNGTEGTVERVGRWFRYGERVRVMALRSKHAPHFDGHTLYQGSADRPRARAPRAAADWLDGETVAFLVDFLDEQGDVAVRVYYQDAVVAAPWGFAPDALIAEHPVDVAIFVPATFDQVDWHPEAFVENLQPRRILLGHWENFFVPVDAPTRAVMLTDLGHFESRLERVFEGEWWRPEIGTVFRLPVGR